MEISYWQSRWRKNNIGWHMDIVYPPLPKIWPQLSVKSGSRILVPLCGKSLDMKWFAKQGHSVVGVEVSKKALKEFMVQYSGKFIEDSSHGFTIYRSETVELWNGDFLKLPPAKIPTPDVIYDKASIVAIPPDMRPAYAQKVIELCGNDTQILLQTFEYNHDEMTGPPFSVDEKEVRQLFGQRFTLQLLYKQSKLDELSNFQRRGLTSYLTEKIYLLEPLPS